MREILASDWLVIAWLLSTSHNKGLLLLRLSFGKVLDLRQKQLLVFTCQSFVSSLVSSLVSSSSLQRVDLY